MIVIMGCSSSKPPLPSTPQNNNHLPAEDTKGKGMDEVQKENTAHSMHISEGEDKENVSGHNGRQQPKRKLSSSPSILTEDVLINIEETEEQAAKDIETLHTMLESDTIDDKALVKMLVPVHHSYRKMLQTKYREKFSKALQKEVVQKGPAACKTLFEKLFLPTEEFLAVWLHQLVKTGSFLLIVELLTAWSPSVIIDVKRAYAQEYRVSFEEDLKNSLDDQVSSTVKVVILSLAALQRVDDSSEIDEDASVYESDELSRGKEQIIEVLTQKSYSKPQLVAIFKEYKEKYYLDIRDSIDIEFQDDAQKLLAVVVDIAERPLAFLANELQQIFEGVRLRTDRLLFLLIGRCEIDLPDVHRIYYTLYGYSFQDEVVNKYSGLMKYALLLLVGKYAGKPD